MRLFQLVFLFDQNWRSWTWPATRHRSWTCARTSFTAIERSSYQVEEPFVVDIPGCRDDQIVVGKLLCMKSDCGFVVECGDSFLCAFDRSTQRLIWKIGCVEKLPQ